MATTATELTVEGAMAATCRLIGYLDRNPGDADNWFREGRLREALARLDGVTLTRKAGFALVCPDAGGWPSSVRFNVQPLAPACERYCLTRLYPGGAVGIPALGREVEIGRLVAWHVKNGFGV